MGNCESWAYVDFGEGQVKIRCTQVGVHTQCRCEVLIQADRPPIVEDPIGHNIFEQGNGAV